MKKPIALFLAVAFVLSARSQDSLRLVNRSAFVVGEKLDTRSVLLNENRQLNIYLPEGYNAMDSIHYPVIYLLDGSADEDFIHVAGLMQFCAFPWVNILPKSILVGIGNVDRRRDFTFPTTVEADRKDFPTTGHSGKFIDFMEKELQPFIERQYKTNSTKTLIGQSLGGLLATEVLFKKPQLFNQYIIISPSLWWDKESLLSPEPAFATGNTSDTLTVYVGVGKEGKIMEEDARRLTGLLKSYRHLKVGFGYFSEASHATIFHEAVYKGFEFMQAKH